MILQGVMMGYIILTCVVKDFGTQFDMFMDVEILKR